MRDTAGILLVGALWLSAILAIWVSLDHLYRVNKLQQLYARQPELNNLNGAAQALANEALDYSKTHPAIDPVLMQFDLKPRAASTNQPAKSTNQPAKTR
jgi:hypothetical protein